MTQNVENTLQKAQTECSRTGLRLTDKRCKVLKILLESQEPLSAYELMDRYKAKFNVSLSAMSAYRMLDVLVQANMVHKLETTNQYLACAHISCEHEHPVPQFLICDQCHSVKEIGINVPLLKQIKASINRTGFLLAGQQLELHGTCRSCRKKPG